jgi:hypothetical protein
MPHLRARVPPRPPSDTHLWHHHPVHYSSQHLSSAPAHQEALPASRKSFRPFFHIIAFFSGRARKSLAVWAIDFTAVARSTVQYSTVPYYGTVERVCRCRVYDTVRIGLYILYIPRYCRAYCTLHVVPSTMYQGLDSDD